MISSKLLSLCKYVNVHFPCSSFASALSKASNEKRMKIPPAPIDIYSFQPRDDLEGILKRKFAGCDIVIVILDGKQRPTYSK